MSQASSFNTTAVQLGLFSHEIPPASVPTVSALWPAAREDEHDDLDPDQLQLFEDQVSESPPRPRLPRHEKSDPSGYRRQSQK